MNPLIIGEEEKLLSSKREKKSIKTKRVVTPQDIQVFNRIYRQVVRRLVKETCECPIQEPQKPVYRILGLYGDEPVGIGSSYIETIDDPKEIDRIFTQKTNFMIEDISSSLPEGESLDDEIIQSIKDERYGITTLQIGRIGKLGVLRNYRHRGVGSALLDKLEQKMGKGIVECLEFDVPTIDYQYYARRGYRLVEQGESILDSSEDLRDKSMQFRMFKYT